MKEIRWHRMFLSMFCVLTLLVAFSWGSTACRPSGPQPGKEKKTSEKAVTPDGGDTQDSQPPKEGDKPKGDKDSTRKELTIMDIQNPKSPKHVGKGSAVVLKGVVVVSTRFLISKNTGLQGFFVADGIFPTKKWGGILVVVDKDFTETVAIGDKVDVEGSVDEFNFLTQVVASASRGGSVTKVGTVPPADIKAVVVKPEDIPGAPASKDAPEPSKAEPYESVLVELKDVEVTKAPDKYGMFEVTGGVVVDDNFFKGYAPKKGDKIKFIRGVLYYYFDLYRLVPRNYKDVDGAKPQCTKDEDCGVGRKCQVDQCVAIKCTQDSDCRTGEVCNTTASRCELPQKTATVMDIQNTQSPNHTPKDTPVELKGVIVTSGIFGVSKNLNGFFVSDASFPKQWGGVMVTVPKSWTETVAIGDEVDIKGRVSEYYDNTQVSVSIGTGKTGSVTKTGKNQKDKVVPVEITLADLPAKPADSTKPNDSKSEALEGVLIELKNVTVSAAADQRGQWKIDGGLIIDDSLFAATPAVGDKFTVLRGIVKYAFGSYQILPRSADDLKK